MAVGTSADMAMVERVIGASPEKVYSVLTDGWTYSDWVVGTAHIRAVDSRWPEPGTKIHFKAGPWPMSIHDSTVAVASEPPRRLVLRPRLWPLGELTVRIELTPVDGNATKVTMQEDVESGPVRWLRTKVNDLALHGRNRESLRRLADIAERR